MASLLVKLSANRPPFDMASMGIEKEMKRPNIISYAHALCSPTRHRILTLLGTTGLSVTAIAASTGLVSSTVCFHLNELMSVGLVTKRRRGRFILYRWSDMRLSMQVEKAQPAPPPPTMR